MRSLTEHRSTGSSHRYQRHQPENTSLYPIVEQHLPTLRKQLEHHEASLPRFVLSEFQDYLRCGRLEYGFVRVKCNGCRHEHLVAFSCKRRGFCPPCGARTGVVTLIQRFGSALNLNVHLHMLILNGGNSRSELLS